MQSIFLFFKSIKNDYLNAIQIIKFTLTSSVLCFFLTHAYFFLGSYANEDHHHTTRSFPSMISSGRWLGTLQSNNLMPWVIGITCCLLISLAVLCIVSLFKIKNRTSIFLISFMMTSFPSLAYSYAYLFQADVFSISLFSAVFSVWVTTKYKFGFLLGSIFIMISLAEYQSYIGLAVTICLINIIFSTLDKNTSFFNILFLCFKYLFMGILGVILYFRGLNIALKIKNTTLSNYKGVDTMGQIDFENIELLLNKTYDRFFGFFTGETFFYVDGFTQNIYYLNMLTSLILLLIIFIKNNKDNIKNINFVLKSIFLILLVILTPIAVNFIDFAATETEASVLNIYQMVFLFLFPLFLFNNNFDVKLNEFNSNFNNNITILSKNFLFLILTFICITNFLSSNLYYLKVSSYYEQTALFYNRLFTRIEMHEDFDPSLPIAFISNNTTDFYGNTIDSFPNIINDTGLWGRYIGISPYSFRDSVKKVPQMMNSILGINLKTAPIDDVIALMYTTEYMNLDAYPAVNCIKLIDDILFVKMLDTKKIEITQEDNYLNIELIYPEFEIEDAENYELAWYIYRDDEIEHTYWYEPKTSLQHELTQNGVYYVSCFIRDEYETFVCPTFDSREIIIDYFE